MRKKKHAELDGDVGFQIAPMLDVIFVIMLFFMSLATDKVVETQLKMTLPSTEPSVDSTQDTPMEETIAIDAEGNITHNEEPVNANELKATFKSLKDQSTAEGDTPIIVTISAASDAKWDVIASVMNAMQAAKITNVSFSVEDEF
ncbi:MAG: biopolymer transporter ExbD [Verrucomicrobiales bacterium]|nr:biopolymer transporter ExbD [Verrucomicrobiales bacterium]